MMCLQESIEIKRKKLKGIEDKLLETRNTLFNLDKTHQLLTKNGLIIITRSYAKQEFQIIYMEKAKFILIWCFKWRMNRPLPISTIIKSVRTVVVHSNIKALVFANFVVPWFNPHFINRSGYQKLVLPKEKLSFVIITICRRKSRIIHLIFVKQK